MLQTELDVDPWKTLATNLDPAWVEEYVAFLQEFKSVETEHVYSRAVVGFYKESVNQEWASVNVAALQDSLRDLRRRKGRRLPRFPQFGQGQLFGARLRRRIFRRICVMPLLAQELFSLQVTSTQIRIILTNFLSHE